MGVPPAQLGLAQKSTAMLDDAVVHVYLKELVPLFKHVPTGSQETWLRACVVMGHVLGAEKAVTTTPPCGPGEGNAPVTQV